MLQTQQFIIKKTYALKVVDINMDTTQNLSNSLLWPLGTVTLQISSERTAGVIRFAILQPIMGATLATYISDKLFHNLT